MPKLPVHDEIPLQTYYTSFIKPISIAIKLLKNFTSFCMFACKNKMQNFRNFVRIQLLNFQNI
jgi:hypothetical protein